MASCIRRVAKEEIRVAKEEISSNEMASCISCI